MKTLWDSNAKKSLRQIANYIKVYFGSRARREFMQSVEKMETLLKSNPYLGSIDPLFDDRPITYRSVIISRLSKLVYNIDGDTIYIAGFWDCRREPNAQAGQVK